MNEAPGGSRLGHDRYLQTTAVQGLSLLAGWRAEDAVSDQVIHGHLSELMWASKFDYVICDVSAWQKALAETILQFQPGSVIITVALDSMDLPRLAEERNTVHTLAPAAQLIFAPTFFQTALALTVTNLRLLNQTYDGAVIGAQVYRAAIREAKAAGKPLVEVGRLAAAPVFAELVRWIQRSDSEILFGR